MSHDFRVELPLKFYEAAQIIELFPEVSISYSLKSGRGSTENLSGDKAAQYFAAIFQGGYEDGDEHLIPNRVNRSDENYVDFTCRTRNKETEIRILTSRMELDNGKEIKFKTTSSSEIDLEKIIQKLIEFGAWNRI